tara:strand:+ start:1060 stop:1422 length:363 start_codon:yes stop_codon:yes gene_type:complete
MSKAMKAMPRSKGLNLRCKPQMINRAAKRVRGMVVSDAIVRLTSQNDKASRLLLKLLNEAIANAEHNLELPSAGLVISCINVGNGVAMKRFRPVMRGMAHKYKKRTANVEIILGTGEANG